MSQYYNPLSISAGFLEGKIVQRALPTPSQGENTGYMQNLDLTNDALKEGLETAVSTSYNNGIQAEKVAETRSSVIFSAISSSMLEPCLPGMMFFFLSHLPSRPDIWKRANPKFPEKWGTLQAQYPVEDTQQGQILHADSVIALSSSLKSSLLRPIVLEFFSAPIICQSPFLHMKEPLTQYPLTPSSDAKADSNCRSQVLSRLLRRPWLVPQQKDLLLVKTSPGVKVDLK